MQINFTVYEITKNGKSYLGNVRASDYAAAQTAAAERWPTLNITIRMSL
jgi:hypothetical protein